MLAGVELREIRAFLALAEELHFGRAGQRLGVSPSRISQTIRMLETRLGGRLFERSSRRVRLTAAGEQLRDEAGPALGQLEAALRRTGESITGVGGTLRLGMYATTSGGPHLLQIVKAFEARHPECRVTITNTGFERDPLDWLHRKELDVLAMRLPLHDPDITIGPILSTEPRVLALARDHPLANRDSVGLDDLVEYSLSDIPAFPREMMDAFVPPVTPSGTTLRRIPRNFAEVSVELALGKGVHPTVPSFFEHYPHPDITSVPMPDLPPSHTALVWLSANASPKTRAFARAAADVLTAAERSSQRRPAQQSNAPSVETFA